MFVPVLLALALATPDLRLELTRESLIGTHYRYRQFIAGSPVVGGELNVTVRADGTRSEQRALARSMETLVVPSARDLVFVNDDGVARLARR